MYEVRKGLAGILIRATETSQDFTTSVVASTSAEDSHDDIVLQSWKLSRYKANPVVLWSHNPLTPPVGRATSVSTPKATGNLTSALKWDVGEHNPLGTTVGHQFKNKMLSAVSVGFVPGKKVSRSSLPKEDPNYKPGSFGQVLSNNLLLEISAVTLPANHQALAIRRWANEKEGQEDRLERYLTETNTQEVRSFLLDVLRNDPEFKQVLSALLLNEVPFLSSHGADRKDDTNDLAKTFGW